MKPDFFKNEVLAALPDKAKILFIGLWCMADREGRLEDRPKRIEAEIFPYQKVDVERLLSMLASTKDPFIHRYDAQGMRCIEIHNFVKHQHPHPKEPPSRIPKAVEKHGTAVEKHGNAGPLIESPLHESMASLAGDVIAYFNQTCGKALILTPERRVLVEKRLAQGRTIEEMKLAIDNFVKDDWPDRHKYMDLIYVIGVRNKIDNLDRWLNRQKVVANDKPDWQ